MDKEQQIKEVSETYEDIKQGLEIGTERFLKNMKNVLEIEKRQAVKEFAEWVKSHIADVPFCNQKAYNVFCDMVNEKLKEYEQ